MIRKTKWSPIARAALAIVVTASASITGCTTPAKAPPPKPSRAEIEARAPRSANFVSVDGTSVRVPASGRVRATLASFGLNSQRVFASDDQAFRWVHGSPNIPYYAGVLKLVATGRLGTEHAQEILWNLENGTRWEEYPVRSQAALREVDHNAPTTLPSHLRSSLRRRAVGVLISYVPGAGEIEKQMYDMEGRHADFHDLAKIAKFRAPRARPRKTVEIESIPDSILLAEVHVGESGRHEVTFYNPTTEAATLDLATYYLKPDHEAVQRIGLTVTPSSSRTAFAKQ